MTESPTSPPDGAVTRVASRREQHRGRPWVVRIPVAALGIVIGAAAIPLLLIPELGLPLLLLALRILALEFTWAVHAQGWIEARVTAIRRWFTRCSRTTKFTMVAVTVIGAILIALPLIR